MHSFPESRVDSVLDSFCRELLILRTRFIYVDELATLFLFDIGVAQPALLFYIVYKCLFIAVLLISME